ncbi:unnamed protein product [Phytomonas sp. EM1]|nr:unnamed protein product [Phytomonas sp. EM1]|eukprot:CCW65777.1 unnamed protein product [Phytomonas sp. isolate EM1]
MGPLREIPMGALGAVASRDLRPVDARDLAQALRRIKPSVGPEEVRRYAEWNRQYGSFMMEDGGEEAPPASDTLRP